MIASALGPVFLLIMLGAVLNWLNFPGRQFWPGIERLTYYLLFPALLVHRIALTDLSGVSLLPLAAVLAGGLGLTSLLVLGLQYWLRADAPALTSAYQGAIRFNTFIGLAAASALFGDAGLSIAAVVIGLKIPLVNVACVLAFAVALGGGRPSFKKIARDLATNPLIVSCVIGLILNLTGAGLPGWTGETLAFLGATALPLGLLAVGVALNLTRLTGSLMLMGLSSVLKFAAMPLIMWGLAVALNLSPAVQQIVVLLACMPTASSGYILARQLGGDASLMANIITVQSLIGFAVIPLWVWALL